MESSFLSRLPSIISSKPFYVSPYHKPSPFRYRERKESQIQARTMQNSRVIGHQKDLSKVHQLRYYIESTIQIQKRQRIQSLAKKKQMDQIELQKKKQRIQEQRRRHQMIMKQMKEYLVAMRKFYWVRYPCRCGCDSPQSHKEEKVEQQPVVQNNQPIQNSQVKATKYRLNNITHFKSSDVIPKIIEQSHTLKFINKNKSLKHVSLMQKDKGITQQMKQTANNYFSLLTSLQKNVKNHLSSSKGITKLLEQLVRDEQKTNTTNSKNTLTTQNFNNKSNVKVDIRKSILNVLSLTKNNWEDIFKNVVALKSLESKLTRMAKESNYEIEYTQIEKQRKLMMDDMFSELMHHNQYLSHINKQLEIKGLDNEIKERLSILRQQSQSQALSKKGQVVRNTLEIRLSKQQKNNLLMTRDFDKETENDKQNQNEKTKQKNKQKDKDKNLESEDDYEEELADCYAQGHKAQIHQTMDQVILQFMRNQKLIKQRNRAPRKTLLQSLGIQHLVQRNSTKNDSAILNGSFYTTDMKLSNGKRNSSAVPTIKQLAKRSLKLSESKKQKDRDRKGGKEGKEGKTKKKKEKSKNVEDNVIESTKIIEEEKENQAIEILPIQHKRKLWRASSNFLNGVYQKITIPGDQQPESTLNPNYKKQSIFDDRKEKIYKKLKSIKLKKKMEQAPQIRQSQRYFQLVSNHQNLGIVKTRLFQLFKHDDWKTFMKFSEQFLEGQDRMDQNLEQLEKLHFSIAKQDNFDWINHLDFNIAVTNVDVMDLVLSQKIKSPRMIRQIDAIQDHIDFRVEKTMTRYELDCHKKRMKAFCVENSFMKHKMRTSVNWKDLEQNEEYN